MFPMIRAKFLYGMTGCLLVCSCSGRVEKEKAQARAAQEERIRASSALGGQPIIVLSNRNELVARRAFQDQIRTMALGEQWGELDTLAAELRSTAARFPNGAWKLSHMYDALATPAFAANDDTRILYLKQLDKWAAASKGSPTARAALAGALTEWAWDARGSGYANTVSPQQFVLFKDRLKQAWKQVDYLTRQTNACPYIYEMGLEIGRGLEWEKGQTDAFFREGVSRFPDYERIYYQRYETLLPKWAGAHGECEAFLLSIATNSAIPNAELIYAKLLAHAWRGWAGRVPFHDFFVDWSRARAGLTRWKEACPDSLEVTSWQALFSGLAGDVADAARYMRLLNGRCDPYVWGSEHMFRVVQMCTATQISSPTEWKAGTTYPMFSECTRRSLDIRDWTRQ